MTIIDEVLAFSRAYINSNAERTPERIRKIREAYKQLTGENLRTSCSLCYIETLFKIRSIMEKKACRYLLKPGALLTAFGDSTKTCTNANLTDELAEWHLRNNPGVAKYFSKIPELPWEQPADTNIVAPVKTVTGVKPEDKERLEKEKAEALKAENLKKSGEVKKASVKPIRSHKAKSKTT